MAECIICNKKFYRRPCFKGTDKYRCCSWACRNISMKGRKTWNYGLKGIHCSPRTEFKKGDKRITGKNNPNWKGGISPKNKIIRISTEYKNWRKKVFELNDYTCQGCGDRGVHLEPHHALSFVKYPQYRFEPWNGQTVCRDCHKNLHDELGWGR